MSKRGLTDASLRGKINPSPVVTDLNPEHVRTRIRRIKHSLDLIRDSPAHYALWAASSRGLELSEALLAQNVAQGEALAAAQRLLDTHEIQMYLGDDAVAGGHIGYCARTLEAALASLTSREEDPTNREEIVVSDGPDEFESLDATLSDSRADSFYDALPPAIAANDLEGRKPYLALEALAAQQAVIDRLANEFDNMAAHHQANVDRGDDEGHHVGYVAYERGLASGLRTAADELRAAASTGKGQK